MYQARGVIDTLIVSENLSRSVGCIFVVQVYLGGGIAYWVRLMSRVVLNVVLNVGWRMSISA